MSETESTSTGRFWPIAIVVLLGGLVTGDIIMLIKATSDPSFAVEDDYYQKAENWDEYAAQRDTNSRLGWRAVLTAAVVERGAARVSVILVDREGTPIPGAAVSVVAFHNARASNRLEGTLTWNPDGSYETELPLRRPGIWEFRLLVTRGEETFTQTIRHELGTQRTLSSAAGVIGGDRS